MTESTASENSKPAAFAMPHSGSLNEKFSSRNNSVSLRQLIEIHSAAKIVTRKLKFIRSYPADSFHNLSNDVVYFKLTILYCTSWNSEPCAFIEGVRIDRYVIVSVIPGPLHLCHPKCSHLHSIAKACNPQLVLIIWIEEHAFRHGEKIAGHL